MICRFSSISRSILAAGWLAGLAVPAWSSERSQEFVARGRQAEARGDAKEAAALYGEAVRADPRDKDAHYRLAVLQAAQGGWDKARASLLETIAIDSDYLDAQFRLGVAYYHLEYFREALDHLGLAAKKDPGNAQIPYYQGLVHHKSRDYVSSPGYFQKAMQQDPKLGLNSQYHIGVAYFRQNRAEEAVRAFREVIRLGPTTPAAQSSQQFLTALEGGEAPKDWGVEIGLGAQLDDNLRLESDDFIDAQDATLKEENDKLLRHINAFAFLNGRWSFVNDDTWRATARAGLYKSYHPDLIEEEDEVETLGLVDNNRYDLLDVQPGLDLDYNNYLGTLPWRLGLGYTFHYSNLDGEAYLNQHKVRLAWKLAEHPDVTFTEIAAGYRLVDYPSEFYESLAGNEITAGLSQYIFFMDRESYFQIGGEYLTYSADNADEGRDYSHDGFRALGRFHLPLIVAFDLKAAYEARTFDDYAERKDNILTLGASMDTTLGDLFNIMLGFTHVRFDSLDPLTYQRNIITLTFTFLI